MRWRRDVLSASAPIGLLAVLASLAFWFGSAGGQGGGAQDKKRCVLVIGIDGLRSDALRAAHTPALDALIATGAVSYDAFAGGVRGTPTLQITSSGPGWSSILTGVWKNKHRVIDNGFVNNRLDAYPHFFKFIKQARPNAVVASFIDWEEIDTKIVEPTGEYFDYRFPNGVELPGSYVQRDKLVLAEVEQYMESSDPDAMFVYFGNVDIIGHSSGFTPSNRAYISAIETTDAQIGKVLEAIHNRPQSANEDWMTIVSTDHGGQGTSHGGQSPVERTIFMIANGSGVQPRVISPGPGHVAVPPTAMRHLGIPVDESWEWESPAFGYPPYCPASLTAKADPRVGEVALTWSPPVGYDLDAQEILRDEQVVATLDPRATRFTDTPPIDPESDEEQTFSYTLRVTGADAEKCRPLTAGATFYRGPITRDLFSHLTFDGHASDELGTLPAQPVNGLVFSSDNDRRYLELRADQSVAFGRPAELRLGRNTDFSVACLFKTAPAPGLIGTILGTRAVEDSSGKGWALGAARSGVLQWSIADGLNGARAETPRPLLADGRWHHLTATHDRDGVATVYVDGIEVARQAIDHVGSITASTDFRIGGRLAGNVADVKIWSRRLLADEVRTLANTADLNHPPFFDAVADLRFDGDTGLAVPTGDAQIDTSGIRGGSATLPNTEATAPSYLSVNSPTLRFGATQDFTASVWVKSDGAFGLGGAKSDPAILSNKNWQQGASKGWIIAAGKDGRWQWNIGDGDNAHRADYDGPPGEIADGTWHHIAATHDRDGLAVLYFDGQEVARRDISQVGDIDSGLPIGIGTDGALGSDWPAWFNGSIDNVQMWRRVLSAPEVAFVFDHFTASGEAPRDLDITQDGNYARITYRRPKGGFGQTGIDYTASGFRHGIQLSSDLTAESWRPLTDSMFAPLGLPSQNGDGTETVTLSVPVDGRTFFRRTATAD